MLRSKSISADLKIDIFKSRLTRIEKHINCNRNLRFKNVDEFNELKKFINEGGGHIIQYLESIKTTNSDVSVFRKLPAYNGCDNIPLQDLRNNQNSHIQTQVIEKEDTSSTKDQLISNDSGYNGFKYDSLSIISSSSSYSLGIEAGKVLSSNNNESDDITLDKQLIFAESQSSLEELDEDVYTLPNKQSSKIIRYVFKKTTDVLGAEKNTAIQEDNYLKNKRVKIEDNVLSTSKDDEQDDISLIKPDNYV